MPNVLVIGIGGTGIKTLLHVKKQLIDQSPDGKLPENIKLLGLDTTIRPEELTYIGGGGRHEDRWKYQQQVSLEDGIDYLYMGGGCEDWVCGSTAQSMKATDHPCLEWLNAKYFCSNPIHRAQLNIVDGAGQFRQIGRLSIYKALSEGGENSMLYQMLKEKLEHLSRPVKVVVCGSTAGGTGASAFIDIAHLTKKIYKHDLQGDLEVYGMLVLPDAFKWNPPVVVNPDMYARNLSCLRELERFLLVNDPNIGFPMKYGVREHPVLDSRSNGGIFTMLYVFDVRKKNPDGNQNNPLEVRVENGVAPTIATWIIALADEYSGQHFARILANHAVGARNRGFTGTRVPAMVASIGAYSKVLPIAAIVEEWKNLLALEMIDLLVPIDENGNIRNDFSGNQIKTPGHIDADNHSQQHPSLVYRDAYEIGSFYSPGRDNSMQRENIINREICKKNNSWEFILNPSVDQNLDQTFNQTFMEMAGGIEKEKYFYNSNAGHFKNPLEGAMVANISARATGGDTEKAADMLINRTDNQESQCFSRWKTNLLNTSKEKHIKIHHQELMDFVDNQLNGNMSNTASNSFTNKAGKIGWLWDYIKHSTSILEYTKLLFEEVKTGLSNLEDIEHGALRDAEREMRSNDRKQKKYLEARQRLFDIRKKMLCCEIEMEIIDEMLRFRRNLSENRLKKIIYLLREDRFNIYNDLKSRMEGIKNNRRSLVDTELQFVREIVYDQEWENRKYREYTGPDAEGVNSLQKILKDCHWNIQLVNGHDDGSVDIYIELEVEGFDLIHDGGVLETRGIQIPKLDCNDTEKQKIVKDNVERLITRTRDELDRVWDEMNILDYLVSPYGGKGQQLADEMSNNCDVLTDIPQNVNSDRYAFLLAPEVDQTQTTVYQWKTTVYNHLSDIATTQAYAGNLPHVDKTSFTYITLVDFIPLEKLNTYIRSLQPYMALPVESAGEGLSRAVHHVFPAEQNITRYDYLDSRGQIHLTPPRVTALFEDKDRFDLFLQALSLGYMENEAIGGIGYVRKIVLPVTEEDGFFEERDSIEYLMNPPNDYDNEGDVVPLLIAAETFCLQEVDESENTLPLTLMRDRLQKEINNRLNNMAQDKEKFLKQWMAGKGDPYGVKAAGMPEGKEKEAALRRAIQRILYTELGKKMHAFCQENIKNANPSSDNEHIIQIWEEEKWLHEVIRKELERKIRLVQ